jgi:integrase
MSKKDNKGRVLKQNESQMSDGRYRYRYTDELGNRHAVYSWKLVQSDKIPKGKRDDISLREKEKQIIKDLDDKIDFANSGMSVNQLLERYFNTKNGLANSTKENYLHLWDHNIKPNKFGKMTIANVRKSDVLTFYGYLFKERKMSVGTLQLYQNILFPAFQLAIDDGILRLNPCKGCMKEYKNIASHEKVPLTKDETQLLLEFVSHNAYYSYLTPMFTVMLETGIRLSEMIGLTWDDVDLQNKKISINHQVIYKKKDGKCQFYASLPKNKKSRDIPLSNKAVNALKQQKENTYFLSKSSLFKVPSDNLNGESTYSCFVFVNQRKSTGKPPTPNSITRTMHSISASYNKWEHEKASVEKREEILLPDFTPHTLRHTFCTRMAEQGMNPKHLQEIMGHSNISITLQVYTHLHYDELDKEMRRIEGLNL